MLDSIFNENCLHTMARMPDGFIDLTVTSPPYDDLRDYEGYEFDFESIASELYRVTADDGVLVWVVGDATVKGGETGSSFRQALRFIDLGFKLHDTMIFEKNSSTFPAKRNGNRYTQIFEYMFVFAKGNVAAELICDKKNKWAGHKDYSGKLTNPVPEFSPRTNIWRYVTSTNGVKHPAPFPELLAQDHILTWSKPGAVVYDPFMGSGTTAKMAKLHDRRFVGSEISSNYCAIANGRLHGLVLNSPACDTGNTSKNNEREIMDKQIAALEEALVIWSNVWGNSVTEWGMNRAEAQIRRITAQLETLKK